MLLPIVIEERVGIYKVPMTLAFHCMPCAPAPCGAMPCRGPLRALHHTHARNACAMLLCAACPYAQPCYHCNAKTTLGLSLCCLVQTCASDSRGSWYSSVFFSQFWRSHSLLKPQMPALNMYAMLHCCAPSCYAVLFYACRAIPTCLPCMHAPLCTLRRH